jgi:hypothetical protein
MGMQRAYCATRYHYSRRTAAIPFCLFYPNLRTAAEKVEIAKRTQFSIQVAAVKLEAKKKYSIL